MQDYTGTLVLIMGVIAPYSFHGESKVHFAPISKEPSR